MNIKASIIFFAVVFMMFLPSNKASATLDLEVPLEMVDYGLSVINNTLIFNRTGMYLCTEAGTDCPEAWYDNATYYFEIVAKLNSGSASVTLRDSTNNADKISIPLDSALPKRYRSASWSPASGKNEYRVKVNAASGNADVYSARIIVVQQNATKTRIQIPLVQHTWDVTAGTTANVDTTASTDYDQGAGNKYSIWSKNSSMFGDLAPSDPWTLEAVLNSATSAVEVKAALFNRNGNQVTGTGTELSVTSTTPVLNDSSFSSAAANFDDGEFEAKIKTTNASYAAELRGAVRLYVRLVNLRKAEVYYRVGMYVYLSTGSEMDEQRVLLDKTKFTNPKIYFESTGRCNTPYDNIKLFEDTDDSGSGTAIDSSALQFNSGTKVRKRSGDITSAITSNNRFYAVVYAVDSPTISHAWLVVQATEQIFHRWDGTLKFFGKLTFF